MQKKVLDGDAAEAVVRRQLEGNYGGKLKKVQFRKSWYTPVGSAGAGLWDVEGTYQYRKGLLSEEKREFRYQIDSENGNIIGHEEITPK